MRDTTVELRRRDEAATSSPLRPRRAAVVSQTRPVELLEVRRVRNVFVGTKRVTWVPTARCGSRGCGVRTRDAGPPDAPEARCAIALRASRRQLAKLNAQISTPDLMVRTGAKVKTETRTGDAGATRTPHIRRDISVLWRRILGEYAMWRLCSAKDSACALWSITQSDRH